MEPSWLIEARKHIGVREIPGPQDNPLIVKWGKDAGVEWWNNDDDPWCAIFINGTQAAVGLPGTGDALAQSFRKYGTRLSKPVPGAIGSMPRGTKSWQGHVVYFERDNGDGTWTCIDGNASNMVKRTVYALDVFFDDGIRWPPSDEPPPLPASDVHPAAVSSMGDRMVLRLGDVGPDVEELQGYLDFLGYMQNNPDYQRFGTETRDAVEAFQKRHNLKKDGEAGPSTMAKLLKRVEVKRERLARRQDATEVAAPAAGGTAAVGGALVVLNEQLSQVSMLNDGTQIGAAIASVALIAVVGYFAFRYLRKRAENKAGAAE